MGNGRIPGKVAIFENKIHCLVFPQLGRDRYLRKREAFSEDKRQLQKFFVFCFF